MRRSTSSPRVPILRTMKKAEKGLSMAEICRDINQVTGLRYCGRRKCGFPNPRKRKTQVLFEHTCKFPYSRVTRELRKMEEKGVVSVTSELRFDKFKSKGAMDHRRIVRFTPKSWRW